jgi:hypothetical protein
MLGWTKELYIECNTEWQVMMLMMLENVYRPGRLWHSLDLLCTLFFSGNTSVKQNFRTISGNFTST